MKRIEAVACALLLCHCLCATKLNAQVDAQIQRTNTPPVIDGRGDDAVWAAATAHGMDNFFELPGEDIVDGDNDIQITWKALWDDQNLYVFIDVIDDELVNEDSCDWNDDSVEIYIDAQDTDEPEYNPGAVPGIPAFQFTAIAGASSESFCGEGLIPEDSTSIFSHGINSYDAPDRFDTEGDITQYPQGADVGASVIVNDTNYSFEFAFPWEALEETPANIIERGGMGFGIAVNDDDDGGGRDTQMMWATDLGDLWHVASSFPTVALINETVGGGDPGDFNGDGVLGADDIDELTEAIATGSTDSKYDVNGDGSVNASDRIAWVVDLKRTWIGDANLDGEFSSADFVTVFTAGNYETGAPSGWDEGDWNGDGIFSSADFVAAFTDGGYELGPRAAVSAVPEPGSLNLLLLGCLAVARRLRQRRL
jgi:hypothetical protein